MKLTRALSDLVKYTKSVGVSDIEKQGEQGEQNSPYLNLLQYTDTAPISLPEPASLY